MPLIPEAIPARIRRFMLNFVPSKNVQKLKQKADAMDRTSREVISTKRGVLEKGNGDGEGQVGRGKDIMSILRTCLPFSLTLEI